MDRRTWLDERRAATRAEYDVEAAACDSIDYPANVHARDAWDYRHFLLRAPRA